MVDVARLQRLPPARSDALVASIFAPGTKVADDAVKAPSISARRQRPMNQLIDAARSKRPKLPEGFARHALWMRMRAVLTVLWRPRRGADGALPQWLHLMVGVSDDGLQIPGTRVRLGLDALLGTLLPGAGDALGGVTSAAIMYVAWKRGAPRDLLFKMLGNAALDIGFGSIPFVGDIFDLGFHANRRNLTMLEDYLGSRTRRTAASKLTAVLIFGMLGLLMVLALAGIVGLGVWLWHRYR